MSKNHRNQPIFADQRRPETAFEPARGSTIMSYGGTCAPADLQSNSDSYFHANSIFDIEAYTGFDSGNDCAVLAPLFNAPPLLDPLPQVTHIPTQTPFVLIANATDANDDPLTYTWEQYDAGVASPPEADDGTRAIFRSYAPSISSARVFPSMQYILNNGNNPPAIYMGNNGLSNCNAGTCVTGEVLPSTDRNLHFIVTVRDGRGGLAQDAAITVVTHNTGSAFRVTQPNTTVEWTKGSTQTITWNVASTNLAPINCANVRITLSTNGGENFAYVLAESTPNDGSFSFDLPDAETTTARIRIEAVGNIFFDI